MMKKRVCLLVIVFLLIIAADVLAIEPVRLISSRIMPDFRYEYTMEFSYNNVNGEKEPGFFFADIFKWTPQPVEKNSNGNYQIKITVFDRRVVCSYGGNYAAGSWADISSSAFYDKITDALVIEFFQGKIYTKGLAPYTLPGESGDEILRFSLDKVKNLLTLYLNNKKIDSECGGGIFYIGNVSSWNYTSQSITDSSGWGSAQIKIGIPADIQINYGCDYAPNADPASFSWAKVQLSRYYDKAMLGLHAIVDGSGSITTVAENNLPNIANIQTAVIPSRAVITWDKVAAAEKYKIFWHGSENENWQFLLEINNCDGIFIGAVPGSVVNLKIVTVSVGNESAGAETMVALPVINFNDKVGPGQAIYALQVSSGQRVLKPAATQQPIIIGLILKN